MNNRKIIIIIFLTIVMIIYAQIAVGEQNCSYKYIEKRLITISMEPYRNAIYVEDGAADGTIFDMGNKNIKDMMACGEKIFKPLIANIDNRNKANNCYRTDKTAQVSIGFIAVDILLHSTGNDEDIVIVDCGDDGLGACYKDAYYLRPDVFYDTNGNLTKNVFTLKDNWEKAYKAGKFGFSYPYWAEENLAAYMRGCKKEPELCAPPYVTGIINDMDGFTNVRNEPGMRGKIVRKIYDKEEFKFVKNRCIDWWNVVTTDGIHGYMHKSKIREIKTPE